MNAADWQITADMMRAAERAVIRHFQHYTAEHRADRAASHRLGHRQRTAIGEAFYTHPARPNVAFPTRRAAARAALQAEILTMLVWLLTWRDRAPTRACSAPAAHPPADGRPAHARSAAA